MRDTIDMAREAGWKDLRNYDSQMQHDFFMGNIDSLKAFEALVRADERNRTWTQDHWTEYERSIAAAEREACAKVCDGISEDLWSLYKGRAPYTGKEEGRADMHVQGKSDGADECAAAIRARGNT
jgi:hypothetical protein